MFFVQYFIEFLSHICPIRLFSGSSKREKCHYKRVFSLILSAETIKMSADRIIPSKNFLIVFSISRRQIKIPRRGIFFCP